VRRNLCFIVFLWLVTILPSTLVNGQEEFVPPPARLLSTFHFKQFSGGVVVLKARLNDIPDSLNFILDTGSGGISLDSLTCLTYNLTQVPSDKTIRGIAGVRNVRFSNNNTLHLPGLRVDSLNFHINDYEILSSVYGEHVDGIIGYSFFTRYIVKINYDSSLISVYSNGSMKYPKGGHLLKPLLVNLPIQNARLRDEGKETAARFYFDIGAGLCLLLSTDFVTDSLKFGPKKRMRNTQAEGVGGKAYMKITTIKEFRLGPYRFRRVPAYIFNDDYNVTSYPYLGGLIGNDLLRRFNLIINYNRRDIYLMPNKHFREPFDYAYTGFSFYDLDGLIIITDIMKGSPAEKGGFKVDDVIVAINTNFSNNVQAYKNMLQNTGETFRILINRNGELKMLYLKVKSILR
jgi:hypothetical protein